METKQEMIVHVVPTPAPFFNSFAPMADFDKEKFLEQETKELIITASPHTKTRIHTTIKFGEFQKAVNWQIDGFKTHTETKTDFWSYRPVEAHYFVKSKGQSILKYQDYIVEIAKQFLKQNNIEIDELTIKFIDRFRNWF